MFDLKKRNSLTLNYSHETEEFRRVAVRRKATGAAGECHISHTVDSEVCGSSSRSHSCDRARRSGSDCKVGAEEDGERNLVKRLFHKPQVPPKPAHLQSPARTGLERTPSPTRAKLQGQERNGAKEERSPNRGYGVSVSLVSSTQNRLGCPCPVRGGGSSFVNGISGSQSGPASHAQGISNFVSGPNLESPSPPKRGIHSCSPLREAGHSPAKLSPRHCSPLTGRLRTPSPVQGKMWSYTPAKNSKSSQGLHKISSSKMDMQEKKAKSLSVPNLIVYLQESRNCTENVECSPLKPRASLSCRRRDVTINSPAHDRLNQICNEVIPHLVNHSKEQTPGKMNVTGKESRAIPVKQINDEVEDGKTHIGYGSKISCQWSENENNHEESKDDQSEKETEGSLHKDDESTEQKLYQIANELFQTEKAYVARLHLLDQVFCLRLTEEAGRGSFPPEVIRSIFSNISSIYSFHSQFFLPDLENCIRHWSESPGLGKVLLQHAPFLRMYADYVSNFDHAMELVRTWTERSSAFRNIILDIQSQEVCGSLTLQHHMLEPVQRVPRYEMLLKDYLKKLPKDDPDYDFAQKSLETISMAAIHSNCAIQKAESLKRLLEIYEMVGEEEVVNPTNEFLKEGRLLKLAARNASAMERHLFLFNNFLLCCTPKFSLLGQRFTVRCRIGVDGMQVQQTTNEDYPYSFQVSGKEKTLELQASSEQDRDEWIKVIQGAIDVFQKKNESFKLASRELNVEEPTKELGQRAPRWIRDNEVSMCMKCQEPFNALTRRRHHCRACGCVVCWKCSENKVALEYDGNKLNKVCNSCYSILTSRREEKRRTLDSETSPVSSNGLMNGFLQYGENTKTCQRVWCVVTRTEPPVLHLYAAPQDVKPLSTIHLLGCIMEELPQESGGQAYFCLRRWKTTHCFVCDDLDLKERWLAVLKVAGTGRIPALTTSDVISGSSNGNVSDGNSSSGDEFVVIGNNDTQC